MSTVYVYLETHELHDNTVEIFPTYEEASEHALRELGDIPLDKKAGDGVQDLNTEAYTDTRLKWAFHYDGGDGIVHILEREMNE